MRRLLRVAIPLVVIVVVVGLLAPVLGPGDPRTTPYLSALSDAFATPALARGGCAFQDCAGGSRHNIVCAKVQTPTICTNAGGTCVVAGCP